MVGGQRERGDGRVGFTLPTRQTGEHDLLPGLACRTPGGSNTDKHYINSFRKNKKFGIKDSF